MQPTSLDGMERKSFTEMHCSVAQCLEVIGEWWTMLIVRDAFFGITRFDQLQERLGISRNVLNQRLATLVEHGVLDKVAYSDKPVRYDYTLTDKGRDLWGVLNAMREWGDKHAAPSGPPMRMRHKTCGHLATARTVCSHCGEDIGAGLVRAEAGPGDVDGLITSALAARKTGAR